MTFDSGSGNMAYNRNISINQKRELLWNIVEPGDPYDIKKSLIAKLPGDRHIFMGDCLEMVCLFQAAEIERLIENLDEYRLKYDRWNSDIKRSKDENSIVTHTKFKLSSWHSS
jgi:hypothetical protein